MTDQSGRVASPCRGCTGTCCTGVGSEPCVCPEPDDEGRVASVTRKVKDGLILVFCEVCKVGNGYPDKGMGRAHAAAWMTRHQHQEQR